MGDIAKAIRELVETSAVDGVLGLPIENMLALAELVETVELSNEELLANQFTMLRERMELNSEVEQLRRRNVELRAALAEQIEAAGRGRLRGEDRDR